MKEYCVDLELAKELKENGFPQETYFYWDNRWYYPPVASDPIIIDEEMTLYLSKNAEHVSDPYSAPTSDELLKELPRFINTIGCLTITEGIEDNWAISYLSNGEYTHNSIQILNKKLANALAKMWLYLKKEGYIK